MTPDEKNKWLISLIQRVNYDPSFQYQLDNLLEEKIKFLSQNCSAVVDFGKSSREKFKYFQKGQIKTVDINKFNDYPDIIDDICELKSIQSDSVDGVICNAVLEHVYDPQAAVSNIFKILKVGGYCLIYVPFLYRYHAPLDLKFQDYFRFTKDGIAYLFRNFSEITLYPVRGKFSTMLNLMACWKKKVEKLFGDKINIIIDAILGGKKETDQVSGYVVWLKK